MRFIRTGNLLLFDTHLIFTQPDSASLMAHAIIYPKYTYAYCDINPNFRLEGGPCITNKHKKK